MFDGDSDEQELSFERQKNFILYEIGECIQT